MAGGVAQDTHAGRPKPEVEVAAWVANRLEDRLAGQGIIVNREVEVRVHPAGGIGERTDIHVDAVAGEQVEGAERITVVIEAKGCWHRELRSAMQTQLAERYLSPSSHAHGIYLVIWAGRDRWDDDSDSDRRRRCAAIDPVQLMADLELQAEALRDAGYHIAPVVLDATLRVGRDVQRPAPPARQSEAGQ